MSISVLMPVKNGLPYLKDALRSILDQEGVDLEMLVVDDGSTDGSFEYVQSVASQDPRVKILRNPTTGLVSALNYGLGVAQHEYVARMDADDIAKPGRLQAQERYLMSNQDVAVVGGQVWHIDDTGRQILEKRLPKSSRANKYWLNYMCPLVHPAVMMRKSVIQSLGGYKEAFLAAEDYDLWLRVTDHFKIVNLDQNVLAYRIHSSSFTQQKTQQQIHSIVYSIYCAEQRRQGLPDPSGDRLDPISEADFDDIPAVWRKRSALLTLNYAVDYGGVAQSRHLIEETFDTLGSTEVDGKIRAMAAWILSRVAGRINDTRLLFRLRLLLKIAASPSVWKHVILLVYRRVALIREPVDETVAVLTHTK